MDKLIDEYFPDYCHSLEAVYGKHLMSEGGVEAIDAMFQEVDTLGKRILDIGFGLGGLAFHLASRYEVHVTGLEINPWMIHEAKKRTPSELVDRLSFVLSTDNSHLPFSDASFDLVCSKGVLVTYRRSATFSRSVTEF